MSVSGATRNGETVLITGASSGIGYELARLFARDGYRLVLVARNRERLAAITEELQRLSNASVILASKDLSQPRAPEELFEELQRDRVAVDVLVNNAGIGLYGLFTETDLEIELSMMRLNMVSLTHLTKLCLPHMLGHRAGKILNVASTAAFQPGPLMAVYYATKAYVLSFSEALANELRGTGVTVTALCPGPTATGFQRQARLERSRLFASRGMNAATVAKVGYRGLLRHDTVVIPGLRNQILAQVVRLTPRNLVTHIVRGLQERTKSSAEG